MKKFVVLVLISTMLTVMIGCNKDAPESEENSNVPEVSAQSDTEPPNVKGPTPTMTMNPTPTERNKVETDVKVKPTPTEKSEALPANTNEPTKTPENAQEPEPTKAPESTKELEPTKAPESTKEPEPTKVPAPTKEPVVNVSPTPEPVKSTEPNTEQEYTDCGRKVYYLSEEESPHKLSYIDGISSAYQKHVKFLEELGEPVDGKVSYYIYKAFYDSNSRYYDFDLFVRNGTDEYVDSLQEVFYIYHGDELQVKYYFYSNFVDLGKIPPHSTRYIRLDVYDRDSILVNNPSTEGLTLRLEPLNNSEPSPDNANSQSHIVTTVQDYKDNVVIPTRNFAIQWNQNVMDLDTFYKNFPEEVGISEVSDTSLSLVDLTNTKSTLKCIIGINEDTGERKYQCTLSQEACKTVKMQDMLWAIIKCIFGSDWAPEIGDRGLQPGTEIITGKRLWKFDQVYERGERTVTISFIPID